MRPGASTLKLRWVRDYDLACAKMRFFWAIFLIVIALACTLFWLCVSISVYESDFSELKNFEIIFFLLTMLGFAASRFGDAA